MPDWKAILMEAVEKAQRAASVGAVSPQGKAMVGIGASGDHTMAADRDAESEILDTLAKGRRLRVVSEEAGEFGPDDAEFTAVVDPIDGSLNFERGIPFYCTSIAIARGRNLLDVEYAVIKNLVNGDVYYAERDAGSTKNGRTIRTSALEELSKSFLGLDVSRAKKETITGLAPLVAAARRQVHYGANALELCMLAEGLIDCFVDVRGKMRIVDFAGAYLIIKEAGATVSSPEGAPLEPVLNLKERFSFVASGNPKLHGEVLGFLRERNPSSDKS